MFLNRIPSEIFVAGVNAAQVHPESIDALLGKKTVEGALLQWIMAIERGDWTTCDAVAARYGLKQTVLMRQFGGAIAWAETSLTSMA
ncbi:MAG: hypothetical protein WB679_11460 [Terracidiphilus sp.]